MSTAVDPGELKAEVARLSGLAAGWISVPGEKVGPRTDRRRSAARVSVNTQNPWFHGCAGTQADRTVRPPARPAGRSSRSTASQR